MDNANFNFIELVKNRQGVYISQDDIEVLTLHSELENISYNNKLNTLNIKFQSIYNGKILGVIVFGIIGFFLAPIFGVAGIVGALLLGSIGWRLFGGKSEKQKNTTTSKAATSYGFNSAPSLVPLGGSIPVIYTNRSQNPNGGYRTSGSLINSRVETYRNTQTFYGMYHLSYGEIGGINLSKTLLNDQLLDTFYTDEINLNATLGTQEQTKIEYYQYYSQVNNISSNNSVGIQKRCTITSNTNYNTFTVSAEDFDSVSASDRYLLNGIKFRVIDKNIDNLTITTSHNLNNVASGAILYAYDDAKFQTTKKCTEIQINLILQLWARDKDNNLTTFGVVFDLYLDNVFIHRFFDSNKKESDLRRYIHLQNLTFDYHKIELVSVYGVGGGLPIMKLSDNGKVSSVGTEVYFSGKRVFVKVENAYLTLVSEATANSAISYTNKPQTSSDRGATVKVTTVNEVVYPNDLGVSAISNYQNCVVSSIKIQASNRIQSDPQPSWFYEKGKVVKNIFAAGYANFQSNGVNLYDLTANFYDGNINSECIIRNLTKNRESRIVNYNSTQIVSEFSLNWSTQDAYVIFKLDASSYFPDIYCDVLSNQKYGLAKGKKIDPDLQIDYVRIAKARKFCVANNFFWDGIITPGINFRKWASEESMSSLLFPSEIGNVFGLIAEDGNQEIVGEFNTSNIIGEFVEEYAEKQNLNTVLVTYTDGTDIRLKKTTITVRTTEVDLGYIDIVEESIELIEVSNFNQALRVGQVYLKTRLLQEKAVSFSTFMTAFFMSPGDLIIVQHATTDIDSEVGGYVTEVITPYSNGTQTVRLSCPLSAVYGNEYSVSVYRNEGDTNQSNLAFNTTLLPDNTIVLNIYGLLSELKATREFYVGDNVNISKNVFTKRTYRINSLQPKDDGSVGVNAILWTPAMLNADGLVWYS